MPFFCNVILKISKSVTLQVRILKNTVFYILYMRQGQPSPSPQV